MNAHDLVLLIGSRRLRLIQHPHNRRHSDAQLLCNLPLPDPLPLSRRTDRSKFSRTLGPSERLSLRSGAPQAGDDPFLDHRALNLRERAARPSHLALGIKAAGSMLLASTPTAAVDLDDNTDFAGWSGQDAIDREFARSC